MERRSQCVEHCELFSTCVLHVPNSRDWVLPVVVVELTVNALLAVVVGYHVFEATLLVAVVVQLVEAELRFRALVGIVAWVVAVALSLLLCLLFCLFLCLSLLLSSL